MKYYLIAAITLLLLAGTIQSQMVSPGFKGGLNVYSIVGNQSVNFNPKFGYHLGVLTHIHVSDQFALQPEAIFSAQGARYQDSDIDIRSKYVNIPVLAQYMFGNGFRLQAGPQVGILAIAKMEDNDAKIDVKDQFEAADLGVTLGMSYIKTGAGLGFDVRYNQGLTDINAVGPYNSFNSGLQVGIFYLFGREH
jgi:hypothetical protein